MDNHNMGSIAGLLKKWHPDEFGVTIGALSITTLHVYPMLGSADRLIQIMRDGVVLFDAILPPDAAARLAGRLTAGACA